MACTGGDLKRSLGTAFPAFTIPRAFGFESVTEPWDTTGRFKLDRLPHLRPTHDHCQAQALNNAALIVSRESRDGTTNE
ncbi:MAG: hypothetical protein PVJ86_11285 [Phycisphaerales bacterium]